MLFDSCSPVLGSPYHLRTYPFIKDCRIAFLRRSTLPEQLKNKEPIKRSEDHAGETEKEAREPPAGGLHVRFKIM